MTITSCIKSLEKNITLLKDDKDSFYLMSKSEDAFLPKDTLLGGIGGGTIVALDPGNNRCIPWRLSRGDRTVVQLTRAASEGDEGGIKATKLTTATLYTIARDLEAQSTAAPKLTSFGQLKPTTAGGQHGYELEYPEGHPKHESLAFVPSPAKDKAATPGNFFSNGVNAQTGVGKGALAIVWRLSYDAVGNALKPTKPHIITSQRLELKKGSPIRVAWP